MKRQRGFLLFALLSFVFIGAGLALGQEQPAKEPADTDATINESQWVWGEVLSLDAQAKTLQVKYLDYETDQEKEMTVVTNETTTYENVESLSQIKPSDTVSIDYTIGLDGRVVAKNISVEKPEPEDNPTLPLAPEVTEAGAGIPQPTSMPESNLDNTGGSQMPPSQPQQ